jgi:RNA polymerase sigma-70 factor (ECF subfamily)
MTRQEFDEAIKRDAAYIRAICFRFLQAWRLPCGDADVADAVQMTMLAAFKSFPSFRGESTFRSWVYVLASRAVGSMGRRENKRISKGPTEYDYELDLSRRCPHNPEDIIITQETTRAINKALKSLRPKLLSAVELRLAEMSDTEAAQVAGTPAATQRTRLMHAHKKLKALASND